MPTDPGTPIEESFDVLVAAALDGDEVAWSRLVDRLERVVWKAVNMLTSDRDIRDDAFAATWLRLAERLHTIHEPRKLPGWLTTTACNEVRQIVRQRGHVPQSLNDTRRGEGVSALIDRLAGDQGDHAERMIASERHREVRQVFAELDGNCREIITVLVLADPPLPYDEAAERLGRPVGSLGPARRRCLDKMHRLMDARTGDSA